MECMLLSVLRFFIVIAVTLGLSACEHVNKAYQSSAAYIQEKFDKMEDSRIEKEKDAANWDLSKLDTAADCDYLTAKEKNVILEMNKVRSDPAKYAELYIKPRLNRYSGNLYIEGDRRIQMKEGKKAAQECYDVLRRSPKVPVLAPEKTLYLAAKDHAADQGKTGATGHTGSDGSGPGKRVDRYNPNLTYIGENISYGSHTARDIVVDLLIDDGVPSRRHRKNIMEKNFSITGVAIGAHRQYEMMCVLVYGRSH